jgi:Fur family ferric uptake transcriptional regulator
VKTCAHSDLPKRQEISALTNRLRRHSRKITGPRQAILKILHRQSRPLTTREILAAINDRKCDLATIYRAMHLLEKMQIVKRVHFGDGAVRFELAEDGNDGHHHHLVCTKCGAVVAIEECFLREIESRLATANGFTAVTHRLEFFGICSSCRRRAKPARARK